jgi:alpha-tubulin suppressor-like RCC1 family protein
MRKLAGLFVAVLTVLTCTDREPAGPTLPGPRAEISDGSHQAGNAHFFFLPPLVPAPTYSGTFDPSLSPLGRICEWTSSACGAIVAEFTTTSGPGSQTVRVDATDELYLVNWRTDVSNLDPAKTYRIQVSVAGTELGFADVDVTDGGRELKNVGSGEYVGLLDGKILPIKFRIQEGAVYVVGPTGGTIMALGGAVTLDVPPGAVPSDVGITIAPTDQIPFDPRTVPGSAFHFGPEGIEFAMPVHLTIVYDPTRIPPAVSESRLRLLKVVRNGFVLVSASGDDAAAHEVSGDIAGFSQYLAGPASTALTLKSVTVGGTFTCGLSTADVAYCWGDNSSGQLGDGSLTPSTIPVPVVGGPAFASVSSGGLTSCGLTLIGDAYCWGSNGLGQIGDGTVQDAHAPTPAASSLSLAFIVAGGGTVCGLTAAQAAYCWGPSSFGGVGAPVTELCAFNAGQVPCSTQPLAVTGGMQFASVVPGTFHTCGLTLAGAAYCWGFNFTGQLGTTTSELCGGSPCSTTPLAVDGGLRFTTIALGDHFTCGIATDTYAYCWGANSAGRLGDNTETSRSSPTPVYGPLTAVAVAPGVRHACALVAAGDAYCWGTNFLGELGTGDTVPSLKPVAVTGGLQFVSISALGDHTCAVTAAGEAYCWGQNLFGELGASTTELCRASTPCSTTPILVSDPQ